MNQKRPNEAPMPDPLAFLITWSTYGTWLPGDSRGWVAYQSGQQLPDEARHRRARMRLAENACILSKTQRTVAESTIREHCCIRNWELFALNCRTNHIHVVVLGDKHPNEIRKQLKIWCTRNLKQLEQSNGIPPTEQRTHWWTERGSCRYLNDQTSLESAITYVKDAQEMPNDLKH